MAKRYPIVFVGGKPQELASGDRVQNGENIPRQNSAPSSPVDGDLWFDSGNSSLKIYNGSSYVAAGATETPIVETKQTISSNYSIDTGNHALSVESVTIANGITVTVPQNTTWTIIF